MQIIENRSRVRGVVEQVSPQSAVSALGTLHLRVQHIRPAATLPDLLSPRQPEQLTVLVPITELADLSAGQTVELDVRLTAANQLIAQPDTLRTID